MEWKDRARVAQLPMAWITCLDAAKIWNVTRKTASRMLVGLHAAGLIDREVWRDRWARWHPRTENG